MSLARRDFIAAAAASLVGATLARRLDAQGQQTPGATMEGEGYRPVSLPAKPGARRLLTDAQRDDVERKLSCRCGCTLDVFTCRTSMPCGFSPKLHADVDQLIDGGHTADEILAAFVNVYGEAGLMAPKKQGFGLLGYFMPFVVLGTGAVAVAALIRKWGARAAEPSAVRPLDVEATPEELARLDAAVRNDER